ncbi:MAG: Gfo/Idh/MocA family oxidoreductase [Phycisphaerales bacterium]|nr:Gfo/Idh/MocA family oxidoreductase [Phycisphaerales bacterium]
MSERVTFGLIGAGKISRSQHLPNLVRAPHIHLKTVCDLNADLVHEARRQYDIPHGVTRHEDLLADPDIEAVLIATRDDVHVPLAIAAMEAGKHVYVEKPLAETPEECRRIIRVQEKSGRRLAVGFNRRMAPAYQLAKRIMASHGGARNLHYRISDAYFIWGKEFGAAPGTRIIHEVCHVFDLLCYLTGSEVTSIYCAAARDDDESMLLRFANGAVASVLSSGYATYDMPKETMEAILELGSLTVSDCVELRTFGLDDYQPVHRFAGHVHPERDAIHSELFEKMGEEAMIQLRRIYYEKSTRLDALRATGGNPALRRQLEDDLGHHAPMINYMMDKGWLHAVDHFAQCLLKDLPCELATTEDGLRAARITQAAIQSRREGRVVRLEEPKAGLASQTRTVRIDASDSARRMPARTKSAAPLSGGIL